MLTPNFSGVLICKSSLLLPFKNPFFPLFFFLFQMAVTFPSCSCSSTSSSDNFRLSIGPTEQPRSLLVPSVSGHYLFPRFARLKIQCPSEILLLSKAFRRPDGIVCETSETSLDGLFPLSLISLSILTRFYSMFLICFSFSQFFCVYFLLDAFIFPFKFSTLLAHI